MTAVPSPPTHSRLDALFDLGAGVLLNPSLRRQDEGRVLAALEPGVAPLAALVRRWKWPMPSQWGSEGSDAGQFSGIHAVAIASGGDIVICDTFNHRMQVFRADGTFVRQWGSQGDAFGGNLITLDLLPCHLKTGCLWSTVKTIVCKRFNSMAASCAAGVVWARRRVNSMLLRG